MITLYKASFKSTECINSLLPSLRNGVWNWYQAMKERGINPYIYFGFRSEAEQKVLHDRYVAGEGPLAAPPGKSYHNSAAAFDWVPLKPVDGYADMLEPDWDDDDSYRIGEKIAPHFGLRPISAETGHLQDARFTGWQDAKRFYELEQWP